MHAPTPLTIVNATASRPLLPHPARCAATLVALCALALAWPCGAAPQANAPLPAETKAASSHAPFVANDCSACHVMKGGGRAVSGGDEICNACHVEGLRHSHAPRKCVRCHSPHDARRPKLLRTSMDRCPECHDK